MEALAAELRTDLGTAIPNLNVYPLMQNFSPTPPCLDLYPADPFYVQIAYGLPVSELAFTLRARVNGDDQDQQRLLLRMMEPASNESVAASLTGSQLGGTASYVTVEPPTEFQLFPDPEGTGQGYLGCTWRTRVGL